MHYLTKLRHYQEMKLEANDHKDGWCGCSLQYLSMRITQEKKELIEAVTKKKSIEEVWAEAADIANFAMMIANNYEGEYQDKEQSDE